MGRSFIGTYSTWVASAYHQGIEGFSACGYINVEACDKTGDTCAIVTGVKTHDDMLVAEIRAVSNEAEKLGLRIGMEGQEALEMFR